MVNPERVGRLSGAARHGPLSDVPYGRPVRVVALPISVAADLVAEGLGPGARVTPEVRAPLGGPLLVRVGRARVAISASVAREVLVEADERGPGR